MLDNYIIWLKDCGKMDNTIKTYTRSLKKFVQWYEESYGREFDGKLLPLHIRNFKSYLMTIKKLSAKTINNYLSALKICADFLMDQNRIKENPVIDEYFIKIQGEGISPCKITEKDFNRLEEAVVHYGTARDVAVFYMLGYEGVRVSELCNICLNDLKPDDVVIYYGKGGKQRSIPLKGSVKDAINKWLSERENCKYKNLDYLFISNKGKFNRSTINKMLGKYCLIAKIKPIGPHQLRHYFCKNALKKGFDITEVAALAGHARITTTQIYINPSRQELKEKMERL